MQFFLGFDGGAAKTECVLMDEDGRIRARVRSGPSNPLRAGYHRAWRSFSDATDTVMAMGHLKSADIAGVGAGIAGTGGEVARARMESYFHLAFPLARLIVCTDLEIALEAAIGEGEGMVLIGGTGSAALGRDARGRMARAGGWGPWIGDEGSAFDTGRRACAAAAVAADRRGPATTLGDMLIAGLRLPDLRCVTERTAKEAETLFPRIFPIVLNAADKGDAVAREILCESAARLGALAGCVARELESSGEERVVAKAGGMFGRNKFFDEKVDAAIVAAVPQARVTGLRISAAQAAAKRVMREACGIEHSKLRMDVNAAAVV